MKSQQIPNILSQFGQGGGPGDPSSEKYFAEMIFALGDAHHL